MGLARRLEEDELTLLEVIEDPIWLAEFLRSTSDGSMQKEEWPKRAFKYRWYQRDLITDKTPFISLAAGRAVGKCHPPGSRIYTVDGYKTVYELKNKNSFGVYAVNQKTGLLTQRRAFITPDSKTATYILTTVAGHKIECTKNHPILTQRGYVPLLELNQEDDQVAVATFLPHTSQQNAFNWFDLRWAGYMLGVRRGGAQQSITLKYAKQVAEWRAIARSFDATFRLNDDQRTVRLERKKGYKAYISFLSRELGWEFMRRNAIRQIPDVIKHERLENLKVFLEAYFSLHAVITPKTVQFNTMWPTLTQDIQDVLLRFGIETKIDSVYSPEFKERRWYVDLLDYHAYYKFFEIFQLPGIAVRDMPSPPHREAPSEHYRFDSIKSIFLKNTSMPTYAITVWEDHNYICDGVIVHNSLVLEDKIIWESINTDLAFKETKEQTLLTANTSQMTPILDRLIMRFSQSKLLKDFLQGNVNRSKGTFDFPQDGSNYRINARIAGQRGESNMVGLHVNRVKIDEAQLFPMPAYIQMLPAINQWEESSGVFLAGVPNGLREGNVLYFTDQISTKYKKYRVPAHNNPFFTMKDNIESLKQFGGEDSEDYVHLVLGRHGNPAYSVIPREDIVLEPYDFYSYRYSGQDKSQGKLYTVALGTPKLDPKYAETVLFAIDTGFADPTVIQVMGRGKDGRWRTLLRYRLTRIPFPDQIQIINWLDSEYNPAKIGIDLGAGGGGITIMQELLTDRYPRSKKYEQRIEGVRFGDRISVGQQSDGTDMQLIVKAYGGQQLAKMVAEQELVFSEVDMEGVSQLERVAYQRTADGMARYFVLSERGNGASRDDHIFASYVVFVTCLLTMSLYKPQKRLFGSRWIY